MKDVKRYFGRTMLMLAGGVLLVMIAGCDYGYDLDYGSRYSGPNRGSYYYLPSYSGVDYDWYGYRSSYGRYGRYGGFGRYGRGFGGRGYRGRYCD
jgi:hypothetical protein